MKKLCDVCRDAYLDEMQKIAVAGLVSGVGNWLLGAGKNVGGGLLEAAKTTTVGLATAPKATLAAGVKEIGPIFAPLTVGMTVADLAKAREEGEGAPGYGKAIGSQIGMLAALPIGGGSIAKNLAAGAVGSIIGGTAGKGVGRIFGKAHPKPTEAPPAPDALNT